MDKNTENYTKLKGEFNNVILSKSKKIKKITGHVLEVSKEKLKKLKEKLATEIESIGINPTSDQTSKVRVHYTSYRKQTAQIIKILRDELKMLKGEKIGEYKFYKDYQSTRKAFFKKANKAGD